jgi:serine/threonine protein kinase/TolB-like protein/Tfp pilus assembly protein PilF
MTPERYKEVGQLYRAALEVEPERRAAFLAEACDGDEMLRQEVESLLSFATRSGGLIDQPVLDVAAKAMAEGQPWFPVGQSLGHYRILSLLGKGGMGEVYRARDTKLDRTVALKLLPAELAANQERMRRFVREAKAASALNHPHVATIYEIGEAGGVSFIAMEYVEGRTLAAEINGRPLDAAKVIEIAAQVADALDEAHSKGITHRDIKPANLMLTPRGRVKVLDFGLAKVAHPSGQDELSQFHAQSQTTPGVVMGTVAYMSPEQALGREVDHRSDIFSLGVALYEMATGQRPFRGATASETIDHILHSEPEPLAQFNERVPAGLAQIVSKCLEKDREQRYQSARDLLTDLDQLKSGSLSAPRALPTASIAPTSRAQAGKTAAMSVVKGRARWLIAGALVVAVLTAALAYWRMYRAQPAISGPLEIKSLAVLPPRSLQSGMRDEGLELGTTSTLITRLGSLRQLIVRSESAVEKYTSHDQDPLAAGREQKVDAVLDTRYQRSGDRLRFRLRLLRVADGATLWADTLDQQTADPFAIEDALSAKVTGGLKLTLSEAEKELLAKRYTNSAEAWQLYVRGHHLSQQRGIPNVEKAITYLEQAIALDQSFALAYAELGFCYASLTYWKYPPKELMPKAKAANDRALMLDDQLAEAHAFSALYKRAYEWDYDGAEREHRRAIDLNPNSAEVHRLYAFYLTYMGRFEEAISEVRRAEILDPTSPYVSNSVSQVLYFARRYDEAIEVSRRAIDLHSNSGQIYGWMIRAYEMKGDEQGAIAAYLGQAEAEGAGADEIAGMKTAFATGGLKGYWRRQLDRRLEQEKREFVLQTSIAMLYARLGQKEQALARLEKAVDERNHYVIALNVEPLWDSYRADPRFMALVRRVGLEPTR